MRNSRKPTRARFNALVLAAAGAALLGACVFSGRMIYRESFQDNYSHDQLMAFNGGKQMRLDLHGNPFPASDGVVAAHLSKAMHGHNDGLPIDFTATPGPGTFEHSRIVVLFQPPPSAIGRTVCDGTTLAGVDPGAGGEGGVEALMAFCWRGGERSSLRVRMGAISGPQDPVFDAMIGRATNRLLPFKNPFSGSETCAPNC